MEADKLLIPRYKVISEWPDMLERFSIGYIFEHPYGRQYLTEISKYDPADFPGLFKKLQWWEERTLEEMPTYVRIIEEPYKDEVLHLPDYEKGSHIYEIQIDRPKMFMLHLAFTEPVEESDYTSYLKTF